MVNCGRESTHTGTGTGTGILFNLGRPLASMHMATFQGTQKSYYRHVMVTKK